MEFRNPLDDADTSIQAFESDQDGISSVTERSTSPKNGGFKGKLKQAAAATAAVTRNRHPKLDNVKEIKKFMHLSSPLPFRSIYSRVLRRCRLNYSLLWQFLAQRTKLMSITLKWMRS